MTAMPGERMLALAQSWFAPDTVTRIFESLIADYQADCASRQGIPRLRCTLAGVACFAVSFALTFGRDLRRPLPRGLVRRAWSAIAAFLALGVAAQYSTMHEQLALSGASVTLFFRHFWVAPSPWRSCPPPYLLPRIRGGQDTSYDKLQCARSRFWSSHYWR